MFALRRPTLLILVILPLFSSTARCQTPGEIVNSGWGDLKESVEFERFCKSRELPEQSLVVDTCLTFSDRSNPDSELVRVENFVRFKGAEIPSLCYSEISTIEGWRKREVFAKVKFNISVLKVKSGREFLEISSSAGGAGLGVFPFRADGSLNLIPTAAEIADWSEAKP